MSAIKFESDKEEATIKWLCGNETKLVGVKKHHILQRADTFYVLESGGVAHYIGYGEKRMVINETDYFQKRKQHQILYFAETNVLIVMFFDGDHDYIWWWNLDTYDQDAHLKNPTWFNGVFNNNGWLQRYDNRFGLGEEYIHETLHDNEDEHEEAEDDDDCGRKEGTIIMLP